MFRCTGYLPGRRARLGDVNGDGHVDVCGRSADGILCELGTGNGHFQGPFLGIANFTNAVGWTTQPYWGSIRLVDVNHDGKADVCGHGIAGILCGLSQGTRFAP